jgi:hypothetical protein
VTESHSLRHCRDEDAGVSTCFPSIENEGEGVCIANFGNGSGGAFVPGAAVVSRAVGGGAIGVLLECAP